MGIHVANVCLSVEFDMTPPGENVVHRKTFRDGVEQGTRAKVDEVAASLLCIGIGHAGLVHGQEIGWYVHQTAQVPSRIRSTFDDLKLRRVAVKFGKGDSLRQCANGILTAGR